MTPTPILILLAAALGGCATATSRALPVCDGQHRRPANPYGSVLDPTPQRSAPVVPVMPTSPPKPSSPAALALPTPPGCGS